MENVPNIVKRRLSAVVAAVDHPDPDVLTAFFERSLPKLERSRVLEHLAQCSECREVVALALPDEPAYHVLPPVQGRGLSWPRLRWGLVAAGVVIVGSFGLVQYQRNSHARDVALDKSSEAHGVAKLAKNQPEAALGAPRPEANAPAASAKGLSIPAKTEADSAQGQFDRLEELRKLEPADKKAGTAGGRMMVRSQNLAHGPKPPTQWQQNQSLTANVNNQAAFYQQRQASAALAPQQNTNGIAGGPSALPVSASRAANADKQDQGVNTIANDEISRTVLPPSGANSGAEVARAKPAQSAPANLPKPQEASGDTLSPAINGRNFAQSAKKAAEAVRWSISGTGGLQRSFDQGNTWQDVRVPSQPEAARDSSLLSEMKTPRPAPPTKSKASTQPVPIVFRAVAVNGSDVWAGGAGGNLYHSTDSGDDWIRVLPTWRGIELTGDIVNLTFVDTQHGRVVTSSVEIWTTADGGQTWDKK